MASLHSTLASLGLFLAVLSKSQNAFGEGVREGVTVHRLLLFPCFVRACLMTLPTSLMSSAALRTAADIPAFRRVRMGEKFEGAATLSSGSGAPDLQEASFRPKSLSVCISKRLEVKLLALQGGPLHTEGWS